MPKPAQTGEHSPVFSTPVLRIRFVYTDSEKTIHPPYPTHNSHNNVQALYRLWQISSNKATMLLCHVLKSGFEDLTGLEVW